PAPASRPVNRPFWAATVALMFSCVLSALASSVRLKMPAVIRYVPSADFSVPRTTWLQPLSTSSLARSSVAALAPLTASAGNTSASVSGSGSTWRDEMSRGGAGALDAFALEPLPPLDPVISSWKTKYVLSPQTASSTTTPTDASATIHFDVRRGAGRTGSMRTGRRLPVVFDPMRGIVPLVLEPIRGMLPVFDVI